MDLHMSSEFVDGYTSNAQISRILTENWANNNIFCPYCGNEHVNHFENNRPVADFYCPHCSEEYELKSKNGSINNKVNNGAYNTMIERISSINNPNFFFMQYNKRELVVENLIIVPKYFFSTEIIEKRKPLSSTAKRAGWIGCNIILKQIPSEGRIYIVKDKKEQPREQVISKIQKTDFIAKYELDTRGWILDVLNCMNRIPDDIFTLNQMYEFVPELECKHSNNHHVKDKIRQQIQILRDKGIVEFYGRGVYHKI